ncbi:hypothetical protein PACTADRAFT_51261, partial [Pachysolen tannophilus NRRL Y-2460]
MSGIQTSSFVKKLAANDRRTREAAIESLKNYLKNSKKLSDLDYQKLWKGLFYSMWFSDRPRPQQRLANNLGLLYYETIPLSKFISFLKAFYFVISKEWSGIDQWRIDKFYMLIRKVVYYSLKRLQKEQFDTNLMEEYIKALSEIPLNGSHKIPSAIPYHLCDIYLDELEKIMFEDLQEEEEEEEAKRKEIIENTPIQKLLKPFQDLAKNANLKTLRKKISQDFLQD